MANVDVYGLPLTGGADAVAAYNRGIAALLRLEDGAVDDVAESLALDPTFALGHAGLALLGHELCAPVDIDARIRDAQLHAHRGTDRERSHVRAVARHVRGTRGRWSGTSRTTPATRCCCPSPFPRSRSQA